MKLFRKPDDPESLAAVKVDEKHLGIDAWLCHACGACVGICPTNALFLFDMTLRVNDELCSQCGQCVKTCPVGALSIQIEEGA
jgi:ferredoxin